MVRLRKERRRRYIVDRRFQFRYLRNILMLELMVMVTTALVTYFVSLLMASGRFQLSGSYWGLVLAQGVILFIALALLLVGLGLRLSNRISGPIYRLRLLIDQVVMGHLPEACAVRRNDECQDLAAALDRMLATLRRQRETNQNNWQQIEQTLGKIIAQIEQKPDMQETVEQLRKLRTLASAHGRPPATR